MRATPTSCASSPTAPQESDLSVQLEALADEVFEAAAAQGRMAGQSVELPQGRAFWNSRYPDLFFLNGIERLTAPDWSVADFERAVRQTMPAVRAFRAYSRDPATIATLGHGLTKAGYRHEVRLGLVQTHIPSLLVGEAPYVPSPLVGEGQGGGYQISVVADPGTWSDFEESIRIDGGEHLWTPAMIDQFVDLCHWSAANTPVRYYLAYKGERAVAHVGLFQHGATAYLHALYTRPEARRQGAGAALTLAMRGEAHSMGCNRLTLQCVDDGYLPGYYARLGFRPVGEQHIWTKQL